MNSAEHFEAIVHEHYEPLYRFALSLTRSRWDASDLTQHTFYVWATKGHQLQDSSKAKSWLFTTLHRAFLQVRIRQNRCVHQDMEMLEQSSEQEPDFMSEIDVDSSQALLALAEVDEVYQEAVALFYLEDCSYKEISAILDIPLGTVKSRIARGIAQLKDILQQSIGTERLGSPVGERVS